MTAMSLEHAFTGTGQSPEITLQEKFNALIEGGVGTVQIERSFDAGSTFHPISQDPSGAAASYTTASDVALNAVFFEPESDVVYRFNCTAFTSGPINVRLSR